MAIAFKSIVIFCFATTLFLSSSAQKCSNYTFSTNRVFSSCSDLPYLDAHLHWNYIPSTKKLEIAYRAPQTSNGWIAWGINPTGTSSMAGSEALVAFHHSNGSLIAYPTSLTSYNPSMQPGALSFPVSNISAEHANNEMTIFAVVGPLKDNTTINHVWQVGTSVSNNIPQRHPTSGANVQSLGTLDVLSAELRKKKY